METIVALGVFTLLLWSITAVFLMASQAQRRVAVTQRLLNDARYIIESIASDMRIGIPDYDKNISSRFTDTLWLRDEDNNSIVYQRFTSSCAQDTPSCIKKSQDGGVTFSPLTSQGVIVPEDGLRFYISPRPSFWPGGTSQTQPRVTILLTLQPAELLPYQISVSLQTSASSRFYGQ